MGHSEMEAGPMPRADRLPPGAVKLLKEPQLGHVVTLMPDGSPQITVVWIDAADDGSHVLVNTGTKRQKLRNVAGTSGSPSAWSTRTTPGAGWSCAARSSR